MQQGSNLEIPLRVIGPDGTTLWQGSGWLGTVLTGKASATITESNSLMTTAASFLMQASNLAGTTTVIANVLSVGQSGTTPSGLVGAALNSATTAVGNNIVLIAGTGSLALVTTASATGTLGRHLIGGASGVVTDSATAPTNPAQSLGFTAKPSGTTTGANFGITDTGTATRLGAYITIH
jgi:hypothetical protein